MKIEFDIPEENFSELISALNNALLAYNDVRTGVYLMGGLPENAHRRWESLIGNNFDNLTETFDKRISLLKDLYFQLLKQEEKIKDD